MRNEKINTSQEISTIPHEHLESSGFDICYSPSGLGDANVFTNKRIGKSIQASK